VIETARAWPTPVASDAKRPGGKDRTRDGGSSLAAAVRMWPTPTASPYGSSQNGINGKGGLFERPSAATPSLHSVARAEGAPLNPAWIEALMGAPIGWTDVGLPERAVRSMIGSRPAPSQTCLFEAID
jgi:hypothetical protein